MPQYEFKCLSCKSRFIVLCNVNARDEEHNCTNCGSHKTSRLISRFKTIRSEEQIAETLADPLNMPYIDEDNPAALGSWAKKMAREMGEPMDDEIDEMFEEELINKECDDSQSTGNTEDQL